MRKHLVPALGLMLAVAGQGLGQNNPAISAPTTTTPPPAASTGPASPEIPPGTWAESAGNNSPRVWANTDFLLWWTKSIPVKTPLITQALVSPGVDPNAGKLNSTNTAVLIGGQDYDLNNRYGGRFTVGGWLTNDAAVGMEASYLFIAPQFTKSAVISNGDTLLGFPFHNVLTGQEDVLLFTTPGVLAGGSVLTMSNQLQGGEANGLFRLPSLGSLRLTGLAGARFLYFKENLTFDQGNVGVAGGPAAAQIFAVSDTFQTTNHFYGGQVGLRGEYQRGSLFVNATAKVALGDMSQAADIAGSSTEAFAGVPLHTVPGGTFALATNSGRHTTDQFGVVPEAAINVGYDLSRSVRLSLGYTFLYLNNVARPGTEIDRNLNITQSPPFGGSANMLTGTTAPSFSFNRSDFWAQGVTFGVEVRY
jgi:putative beta barrel porin BBP7